MFFTYLRRELRRRMRQAIFIALGLALGVVLPFLLLETLCCRSGSCSASIPRRCSPRRHSVS